MPFRNDFTVSPDQQYTNWIGRKKTSLKRRTLDCGCPNDGEVFYHLGCDRLTCQEHAESPHDCAEFGGAKSGIEEEAVPVQVAVDVPRPNHVDTSTNLPRATDRAAEAFRREVRHQGLAPCEIEIDGRREWLTALPEPHGDTVHVAITDPGDPWSDIVDTYQRIMANPHYRPSRFVPEGAQVTMMTEAEAEGFRAQQRLSLECSRSRPLCSGCDGLAMDNFPCMHTCHHVRDERGTAWHPGCICGGEIGARCPACTREVSYALHDSAGRLRVDRFAPPVDAASEPDLDVPQDRPWWRRMFPRGTR